MDLVDAVTKWLAAAPQEVRDKLSATPAASAHPDRKQAKSDVNYRKADGDQQCGTCSHFDGQGGCQLVAGNIKDSYVCDLYSGGESDAGSPDEPAATESSTAMDGAAPDAPETAAGN